MQRIFWKKLLSGTVPFFLLHWRIFEVFEVLRKLRELLFNLDYFGIFFFDFAYIFEVHML